MVETRDDLTGTHALAQSEERYLALTQRCDEAVLIESGEKIVFANPASGPLFGLENGDELIGRIALGYRGSAEEGQLLHEIAHTFAAASVRLSQLRTQLGEPATPNSQ